MLASLAGRTCPRRYATQVNLGAQSFGISPAIHFVLSANELFLPSNSWLTQTVKQANFFVCPNQF